MLPRRFQQLLDEPPRIIDVDAGLTQPDCGQGVGGRAHCQPEGVFGLAQLGMVDDRGAG